MPCRADDLAARPWFDVRQHRRRSRWRPSAADAPACAGLHRGTHLVHRVPAARGAPPGSDVRPALARPRHPRRDGAFGSRTLPTTPSLLPTCSASSASSRWATAWAAPSPRLVWKRHPDRVSGLVLAATSRTFRGSGLESTFFKVLPPLLSPLALMSPPTLHAAALEAGLLGAYEGGHLEGPEFRRWALNELRMTSRNTTMNALSALGTFDSSDWVGDIDVPTSVVVTLRDKAIRTSPAACAGRGDPRRSGLRGRRRPHVARHPRRGVLRRRCSQACDFVTTGVRPAPVPWVRRAHGDLVQPVLLEVPYREPGVR